MNCVSSLSQYGFDLCCADMIENATLHHRLLVYNRYRLLPACRTRMTQQHSLLMQTQFSKVCSRMKHPDINRENRNIVFEYV